MARLLPMERSSNRVSRAHICISISLTLDFVAVTIRSK